MQNTIIEAMALIKKARIEQDISQAELAERAGLKSAQRISYYEVGDRVPKLTELEAMASVLSLTLVDVLIPKSVVDARSGLAVKLAVLNLSQVSDYLQGNLTNVQRSYYLMLNRNERMEERCFFLIAEGDAMKGDDSRSIANGDQLLIDLKATAQEKDVVLALADGQSVIRELAKDGEATILRPFNSQYKAFYLDENKNDKILGVVIEARKILKK